MEVWIVRGIYLVSAILGGILGGVLCRNSENKGAIPLCIVNFAAAFWAFCLLLSTATQEWLAFAAIRITYLGVGVTVAATFVFALEYTGRERYLTPKTLAVLAIHPVVLVLFAVLNPDGLFFTELASAGIGVDQQWGAAFWVHSAYSYTLVLIYTVLLVGFIYRTRHTLYRGQAAALVFGVVAPAPLNLVYLADIVPFDTTPIGFLVASACYAVAIVRYEYTNISPIARKKVIANVRDGMIVVDTDDRIVDTNPAAEEMLRTEGSMVGASITEVVDSPDVVSVFEELSVEESDEQTVSYGERSLQIESTPIRDDRDRHVGWLFLLDDVTERVRRERDLEQQIEKLDQFASLVSHDLRNPINVTSGYIEQAKATGDLSHLDKAEEATERMEAIIEDVLALAREGQDVTDPEEISLEAVAREAWETVDTEGATLVVERDVGIIADPSRLKRLFENLYRNSLEHGADPDGPSPADLVITVAVEDETPTALTIAVSDNGTGVPEDDRDRVFEDGYTTTREGTGLGLAIVEQIARAHDWTVRAGQADRDELLDSTDPDDETDDSAGGAKFEIVGVKKPL